MLHLMGHFDSKARFVYNHILVLRLTPANRIHETALVKLMLLHSGAAELIESN